MKFLILQTFISFLSVIFLLFLFEQEEFLPLKEDRSLDWYKISSVLFFCFLLLQSVISIILFLIQKFVTCSFKKFPPFHFSLKWSITIAFLIIFIILFNIFHIIDLLWGGIILVFIIIILALLKY
jgi:hypothetical protein